MRTGSCIAVTFAMTMLVGAGCTRRSAQEPAAARDQAAAPAPAAPARGAIRFDPDCFDPYAECDPFTGLPAVSGDATRVAVADTGPESPRDELILTVRVLELAGGRTLSEVAIVTAEDHAAQEGDYGLSDELRRVIGERTRALEQTLTAQGYEPLTHLGVVHEQRPGEDIAGMRASFDGATLVIRDTSTQSVMWQQAIGPSEPSTTADDDQCGPFPVADISVWARRTPPVAVARVGYIGSDLCATESPYLILR